MIMTPRFFTATLCAIATIDPRALPSLNMPTMTMQLRLPSPVTPPASGLVIDFSYTGCPMMGER